MKYLSTLLLIGFALNIYGQEPFFALHYSVQNCKTCTVSAPFGPIEPIAMLIADKGEEGFEFEPAFLKEDSVYKNYMDQNPSELTITRVNQETKETMEIYIRTGGCLNSSLSLLEIPFQVGYFEPPLKGWCNAEVDPEYQWTPLDRP